MASLNDFADQSLQKCYARQRIENILSEGTYRAIVEKQIRDQLELSDFIREEVCVAVRIDDETFQQSEIKFQDEKNTFQWKLLEQEMNHLKSTYLAKQRTQDFLLGEPVSADLQPQLTRDETILLQNEKQILKAECDDYLSRLINEEMEREYVVELM